MILPIKNKIEAELSQYIKKINSVYQLKAISPLLYQEISRFAAGKGKRVRPVLFCIGYLGFAQKPAPGLYESAVSIELLHDFMLIHDDIIDKSPLRRGEPSMHTRFNRYLTAFKNIKFNGEDLSIVAGDVVYAIALNAFLSIKENPYRKEAALRKLIEAALYTGSGEFIELLIGAKPLERVTKNDIYKIYDLKTAQYTFSYPLTIGATLAGADKTQLKLLFDYGRFLGRGFQIKDDIIGVFSEESEIGKSNLTDLQEAKKTILIWYAFQHATPAQKRFIQSILSKPHITKRDLLGMREVITRTGALAYAQQQIQSLLSQSHAALARCTIKKPYKATLISFAEDVLRV